MRIVWGMVSLEIYFVLHTSLCRCISNARTSIHHEANCIDIRTTVPPRTCFAQPHLPTRHTTAHRNQKPSRRLAVLWNLFPRETSSRLGSKRALCHGNESVAGCARPRKAHTRHERACTLGGKPANLARSQDPGGAVCRALDNE
jgi:hypothetical protein